MRGRRLFVLILLPALAAALVSVVVTSALFAYAIWSARDSLAGGALLQHPMDLLRFALPEVLYGTLIVAAVMAAVSVLCARAIQRPIERLRDKADVIGKGDLSVRIRAAAPAEIESLADAFNTMAARLEEEFTGLQRESEAAEAILSSMIEGVIAVDRHECVMTVNDAAAEMFDINRERDLGRPLHELVRNSELQRIVAEILQTSRPVEKDIVFNQEDEQFLHVHGAPLSDAAGRIMGGLVVLHDVTQIVRLQNARRDFVTNVSHELKTPITSIKGYVETLLDGAMNDPEDARRFLTIIARQADRLNSVIDDLLSLSRIEQEADREEIALQEAPLRATLEAAVQAYESRAIDRGIAIHLVCDERIVGRLNPPLFQMAVENLLDNALKYSGDGTAVHVEARATSDGIEVVVRDQGCGIDKHHQTRIFERFYRVDKARSRRLGGTGLGLAIVKHIARVHGGQVRVESAINKGSSFIILLPGPRKGLLPVAS